MNMGKLKDWRNDNCPGEDCPGCGSMSCYASGGKVKEKPIKGHGKLGVEFDAENAKGPGGHRYPKTAKEGQERLDAELKRTARHYRRDDTEKFSQGGKVSLKSKLIQDDPNTSVDLFTTPDPNMGPDPRPPSGGAIDWKHRSGGGWSMLDPSDDDYVSKKKATFAEGGEVEGDHDADDELADAACSELLSAIEKKDKKEILEAIRAIVLSVR